MKFKIKNPELKTSRNSVNVNLYVLYSTLFLLFFTSTVSAQQSASMTQAVAAIREVNETYQKTKNLQMDVNYSLFPDYTSLTAFEKETGVFMKQGVNTYSNLLGITSLRNNKMSITLDSNEESIIVTDAPTKNDQNPSLVDLDTIMKICSSVDFHDLGNQKFYKLHFDKTNFFEYNSIDIYINSETHFLERLILYFRADVDLDETDNNDQKSRPRLEITYNNINTTPVFSSGQFSEGKFITSSGKNMTCVPAYSTYRLVNNKLH